ncbi:MAG: hypothetical protein ACD_38C00158G0008 [uncultured bacterium]|uniref:Uncharacterized protein n=1 Tax=Candidatus Daviesbacteria bacterium GW2011_GWC2_40_12 TaxID=1618431 RepID=A0A0G0QMM8_9BACT|nr:MAG: hypothetical protein ACD_38C00158G0008 [uncultured bacterium]KKQ85530.1 MAG: hypothetical protein UT04_C0002G0002 [Candidatus Daviesbacteria bacterium GW2011_GWF2_38_7]KKR16086.1 MAG: hypothetical protein UT45_C0009G0026 [Candidatus Daviesbacteria bacterium GW2011_GWA2_39_33]KKR25458.1 MAG: hypothetical protein UT54_C0001G0007 [Candidatus Daviesbacteria bacterium GW2011_GWB1_39_5]KKR41654.1 MAG: hypothetical protein UT77_C0008G0026 [Candidatus Daviesbacteria bacterium GW2011_GWC2_40_12]
MVSEDFVKIFYSNFTLNIDWDNIDEITWMYNEGLFSMIAQPVALHDEFNERIELVSKPKNGFVRSGENGGHLALKSLARDHLVGHCNVLNGDVRYEYPLIGFEVDVIDKDLHFPVECGDTNVLKLEKYLFLPATKKMLILPYPHGEDVKVFMFEAKPRFFEYIIHKQNFLNQKNAKLR